MNQQIKDAEQRLKAAIEKFEFGLADIFEFVGMSVEVYPVLAMSVSLHMRDALHEAGSVARPENQTMTFSQLMFEGYRRTFFDQEASQLYGAGAFATDEATLLTFVDFLVKGLEDAMNVDSTEQTLAMLGADTSQSH